MAGYVGTSIRDVVAGVSIVGATAVGVYSGVKSLFALAADQLVSHAPVLQSAVLAHPWSVPAAAHLVAASVAGAVVYDYMRNGSLLMRVAGATLDTAINLQAASSRAINRARPLLASALS